MNASNANRQKSSSLSKVLLFIAALFFIMSLPMMWRLVDRIRFEQTARAQAASYAQQVKDKEQMVSTLKDRLAYAKTEAFIEYYARVQMRLVRPGETLVIPVYPDGQPRPVPSMWPDSGK